KELLAFTSLPILRTEGEKHLMKTSFVHIIRLMALMGLVALAVIACGGTQGSTSSSGPLVVRLGYFPNLTHAVALVGVARRTFQSDLGSKLETKIFNAGPAEIEAL